MPAVAKKTIPNRARTECEATEHGKYARRVHWNRAKWKIASDMRQIGKYQPFILAMCLKNKCSEPSRVLPWLPTLRRITHKDVVVARHQAIWFTSTAFRLLNVHASYAYFRTTPQRAFNRMQEKKQ